MAARVLIVMEHDGRTLVYGDGDVKVYKVEPWNPDEYDHGTVDEQVQRTVPYVYEDLYRADRIKKTVKPRPYQRVVPIEEMDWWEIVKHLCFRIVNQGDSLEITTPLQSQRLLERLDEIQQGHSFLAREYLLAWLFYPGQICPHCKKGVFHE